MKLKLLVKDEAIQDMAEAFDWYENKRSGLGAQFLDAVDEYFDRISKAPEHYQSYRSQRMAVMHRFPFKIVYGIEREAIIVYALYHDRRDPEKLSERE